jgi:ATPase involved in DNA replication initiation
LGGIEEALRIRGDERQAYDDRILGDGDFVNGVLEVVEKQDINKRYIEDMNDLILKLSRYYKVTQEDILEKKTREVKEARNVMIYLAKKYLDIDATATGKLLGITQSSASRAMSKGMNVVKGRDLLEKIVVS